MTVRCNELRVDRDKMETQDDRAAKHIRSVLNLTYAEVENYLNSYREDDYQVPPAAFTYLVTELKKIYIYIYIEYNKAGRHR